MVRLTCGIDIGMAIAGIGLTAPVGAENGVPVPGIIFGGDIMAGGDIIVVDWGDIMLAWNIIVCDGTNQGRNHEEKKRKKKQGCSKVKKKGKEQGK